MPNLQKSTIRKIAKERRAQIAANNNFASQTLFSNFSIDIKPSDIVSGFIPISSEIDPRFLMQDIAKLCAKLCLPRIDAQTNNLNFHEYVFGDALKSGSMGVQEPLDNKEILQPNILLVPLLAFDENLYRLGYGGGYYDRAISSLRKMQKIITIGIGFDEQKMDNIPIEPHDEKLDYILTEKKLYK